MRIKKELRWNERKTWIKKWMKKYWFSLYEKNKNKDSLRMNEWKEGKFKCNNEKEKSYSKEWNWKISKSLRENIVPVGMKERKTDIMAEWMKEKYIYCAKWMEEKKYSLYEWKNSV